MVVGGSSKILLSQNMGDLKNVNIRIDELEYQAEEAFKALRTNVQFCGADKKIISITSCIPNEGKSMVSLKLAASLAESGKKTILIDADLRKSTLNLRKRGTVETVGLSNYLAGQNRSTEVIYQSNVENLSIIFSGKFPPNPAELLGSKRFEDLLQQLRCEYDYIIIDTPPLGSVIDSAVIATKSDGAVIVIEQNHTGKKLVRSVIAQLEKSQCQILGAILNKVEIRKRRRYYGYYYGKYYGNY